MVSNEVVSDAEVPYRGREPRVGCTGELTWHSARRGAPPRQRPRHVAVIDVQDEYIALGKTSRLSDEVWLLRTDNGKVYDTTRDVYNLGGDNSDIMNGGPLIGGPSIVGTMGFFERR